jgi:hypothetical protein
MVSGKIREMQQFQLEVINTPQLLFTVTLPS